MLTAMDFRDAYCFFGGLRLDCSHAEKCLHAQYFQNRYLLHGVWRARAQRFTCLFRRKIAADSSADLYHPRHQVHTVSGYPCVGTTGRASAGLAHAGLPLLHQSGASGCSATSLAPAQFFNGAIRLPDCIFR